MPPFRPPKERIDSLAAHVLRDLEANPAIIINNPSEVKAIFRTLLVDNLREEHEIEEEAISMLRAHGQKIYEQQGDFLRMAQEGKKILAKKKNFTL